MGEQLWQDWWGKGEKKSVIIDQSWKTWYKQSFLFTFMNMEKLLCKRHPNNHADEKKKITAMLNADLVRKKQW